MTDLVGRREEALVCLRQLQPHAPVWVDKIRVYLLSVEHDLAGANSLISQIEAVVPDWRSYRDLADVVACKLSEVGKC